MKENYTILLTAELKFNYVPGVFMIVFTVLTLINALQTRK